MKFEHAQNTLKYKVGDRVQVNAGAGFSAYSKGVVVEYPVPSEFVCLPKRLFVLQDGATEACWFYPDELTLLKAAESSNESGSLVQKISVENDVVSSGVNTSDNQPEAQDNSWYESGGLPPTGANIEYKLGDGPWFEATVKYVLDVLDGDEDEVVIACPPLGFEQLLVLDKHTKIRPIQTPEQIAVQERKKVIDAISDVLIETERMSSYTDVAAHLYESGLRFVEEE